MTANTTYTAAGVELNGRKAYAAYLVPADPGAPWPYGREWCPRSKVFDGRKGWFAIVDRPGWVEVRTTIYGGAQQTRHFEAIGDGRLTPIPAGVADYLRVAVSGPAPGTAGAWFGDKCRCGSDVDAYTANGWPVCPDCDPADCEPAVMPYTGRVGPEQDPF